MRVGSIGYATYQGLGLLLKDFYDNKVITDVFTVEHPHHSNHRWYSGPKTSIKKFDVNLFRRFIDGMDVMFFFETPFDDGAVAYCRKVGIKTILMPMYECTNFNGSMPMDLITKIVNPSLLDQNHFPKGKFIPVPIPKFVKWRLREQANVFVHNAGYLGLDGRNGTKELLLAMQYVKSPIELIVRSQRDFTIPSEAIGDDRIKFIIDTIPSDQLYELGDVFIFPEKFNGLSMPLQEAKAAGMLVMACNRFPINTWTDTDPLIPIVEERATSNSLGLPILEAVVDPKEIAKMIDAWYGKDITDHSIDGRVFGQLHSWESLGNTYKEFIMSCFLGSKKTQ